MLSDHIYIKLNSKFLSCQTIRKERIPQSEIRSFFIILIPATPRSPHVMTADRCTLCNNNLLDKTINDLSVDIINTWTTLCFSAALYFQS